MKKISLLALAVAAVMSSSAFAETGTLVFTGNLNAGSCTVTPGGDAGAGANAGEIAVDMGDVSFNDLETAASGTPTVGAAFTEIDLGLSCTSVGTATSVVMSFDPVGGTGVDATDGRLLALAAGGATGAAIALVDDSNTILDLSANPEITAPLTVAAGVGTADISLRATYIKNGVAEVAGVADASLPFLLSYE